MRRTVVLLSLIALAALHGGAQEAPAPQSPTNAPAPQSPTNAPAPQSPTNAPAPQSPELNEIVVTASRIDSPILESPSAISVVTAEQIASSGATDLSQILAPQPGAAVLDYGPVGSAKSVSLRGSTSDQVLVLLDGVRLNSGRISQVDLSTIPLEVIDHVEILRGPASTMYGSGAIGGVINIITKKPDKPLVSLSVTNGSFIPHGASSVSEVVQTYPLPTLYPETRVSSNLSDLFDSQQVQLSLAGMAGEISLTGGGSITRAANAFTWYDSTQIHDWRRRTNADVTAGSARLGVGAPLLGGEAALSTILQTSDAGTPGSLYTISDAGRQYDTSMSTTASWKTERFLRDDLTLDVKGFYRYDDLRNDDPAYPPESIHKTNTAGLDVTQKLSLQDSLSFVYGGSTSYDAVDSTNYATKKDRLAIGGFLSAPVTVGGKLTLTPAVRYDWFSDFDGSLSYSLGAVLPLSDESSLRASAGSAYRAPALNDLYWYDPLGYTAGNPSLRPETSYSVDVGYTLLARAISIDASIFTRLVFDNIVWLYDASVGTYGTYLPQNLTRTLYPGVEIHAKAALFGPVSLEASYTLVYSFLLNDGTSNLTLADDRRVPYIPLHHASISVRYDAGKVAAGVETELVSDRYWDNANSMLVRGYAVANADVRYRATDTTTFTLAAKNIFNTLYYTQMDYPMPPFSIETGVQVHL